MPTLPDAGIAPRLKDTASGVVAQPVQAEPALLYVCGITPYDSTHLGHASTYLAFDTLIRSWRDAGLSVRYVQNVTDIDDPLLERADATGVDWRELAADQVALFSADMAALRVLPPDHYIGVVESVPLVVTAVERMLQARAAYQISAPDAWADDGVTAYDVYADLSADPRAGSVSGLDEATMETYFAERGGDPDRPDKRHPRDPLLWRAARAGEPDFDGASLGRGRPGWHIECAVIAEQHLGVPMHVQGGGTDLIYPHHEMSTSHLRILTGHEHPAKSFMHTGLVAFDGHKMSKSKGNLVFVSRLLAHGVPAAAIRLTALAHHYTEDWEYTDGDLATAINRLKRWRATLSDAGAPAAGAQVESSEPARSGAQVLADVRTALADDLDTPRALAVIDAWADAPGSDADIALIADAVDALLGIDLRSGRGDRSWELHRP